VPSDRQQRAFALSAARSELFNRVVAERVRFRNWNVLLPGEAVVLDGRQSFFTATELDPALEARCASLDLHPSAPLHGTGDSPARGVALELETRMIAQEPELAGLLEREGLHTERRPTRLVVRDLDWHLDGDVLELRFQLGRGSFATTVLAELVADLDDDTPAIE
jgi:tRNA pseudouridine13 synthase